MGTEQETENIAIASLASLDQVNQVNPSIESKKESTDSVQPIDSNQTKLEPEVNSIQKLKIEEKPTTEEQEKESDCDLFDRKLLINLNYDSDNLNVSKLDQQFVLRPLRLFDYHRGYLPLLEKLTKVGTYSFERFKEFFNKIKTSNDSYYVVVIEDRTCNQVIGTATLLLEYKFIHGGSVRGRLEDVVVNENYRKQRFGSLLIETVRLLAKNLNVYKLSLDCKDEMIPYYEKLGYKGQPGNANTLVIRFD